MKSNIVTQIRNYHPMLYKTAMVIGFLENRKNQTRRLIKSRTGLFQVSTAKYEPNADFFYHNREVCMLDEGEHTIGNMYCPYGQVGDVLWVRETFRENMFDGYHYRADGEEEDIKGKIKWKPNIFMPKEACRIFHEITDIRIERLQDISREDAIAEGVFYNEQAEGYMTDDEGRNFHASDPRKSYMKLWIAINGPESWDENPWIWVINFKQIEKPDDFLDYSHETKFNKISKNKQTNKNHKTKKI